MDEYTKSLVEKLKHEKIFDIEAWYTQLKDYTFKTEFLNLKVGEGKALRRYIKEVVVNSNKTNYPLLSHDITQLQNVMHRISHVVENTEPFSTSGAFIRLSTRSPKDTVLEYIDQNGITELAKAFCQTDPRFKASVLREENNRKQNQKLKVTQNIDNNINKNNNNNLQNDDNEFIMNNLSDEDFNQLLAIFFEMAKRRLCIKTAQKAMDMIIKSERTFIDVNYMLRTHNYFRKRNNNENNDETNVHQEQEKQEDQESINNDETLCKIVIRQWIDFQEANEFRGFFYNKQLTAISQYNDFCYFPKLVERKKHIQQLLIEFFEKIKKKLPMDTGVIDFCIDSNEQVYLIELNPFNNYHRAGTGGALFSWREDEDILKGNAPFEFRVLEKPHVNLKERTFPTVVDKIYEGLIEADHQNSIFNKCILQ